MINKSDIHKLAVERYGDFWDSKPEQLDLLIEQLLKEIKEIEKAAEELRLPSSTEEAKKIKAVWVISGAGTYTKPITNTSGDLIYKDKKWAYFSDRDRIAHAIKVIDNIALIVSKENATKQSQGSFSPYLVYNGIDEQVNDLIFAIKSGKVSYPLEKLLIPKGRISRTLDQILSFDLPDNLVEEGDTIGIVSHAPHLARAMRMINKYKPLPKEVKVKLFPIVFNDNKGEEEFTENEIMGIVGYISRNEATIKSYPYEI
jgi:hypothetical protein